MSSSLRSSGRSVESSNRREFIKWSGASITALAAAIGGGVSIAKAHSTKPYWEQENWESEPERTIIGYCYPSTGREGDTLDFRVSTYNEMPYRAELVRVIMGNIWPAQKMQKEVILPASFTGEYSGRKQTAAPGSFAEVKDLPDMKDSFTVQTFVDPRLILKEGEEYRPFPRTAPTFEGYGIEDIVEPVTEQTLLARWDANTQQGWSLYLDNTGRPAFRIAGPDGTVYDVTVEKPLRENRWFLVAASYDADAKRISVSSRFEDTSALNEYDLQAQSATFDLPTEGQPLQKGPLRIGAVTGEPRGNLYARPVQCLNGRLDSPRLTNGVLTSAEVEDMAALTPSPALQKRAIGIWDFAAGIGTTKLHDISKNKRHGETYNLPYRGIAGVRHDGIATDWRSAPEQYGACHFHDDDLLDAQWEADFSFTVPKELKSGIYAVRLTHGDFVDHIPFFIAPPKNTVTSKIAYLLPTATYAAYSNFDEQISVVVPLIRNDAVAKDIAFHPSLIGAAVHNSIFLAKNRRDLGGGVYRSHTDGSPHWHSSQRVPNLSIQLQSGYSKLSMDTFFTDWLAAQGFDADIITDDLLQSEGKDLLSNYTVVITGHHPEYYSGEMLDTVEGYSQNGGRFMYLGGNGFLWSTGYHPSEPGVMETRKIISDFKSSFGPHQENRNEFDKRPGSLWRLAGRPPAAIVGVSFDQVTLSSTSKPYRLQKDAKDPRVAFMFEGITEEVIGDYGFSGNGAAGMEVDRIRFGNGTPHHTLLLARSEDFDRPWGVFGGLEKDIYTPRISMPRADIAFFETTKGGAVFSVGSMSYMGSLPHNGYDNAISRLTLNVLRRFMDETPFVVPGR